MTCRQGWFYSAAIYYTVFSACTHSITSSVWVVRDRISQTTIVFVEGSINPLPWSCLAVCCKGKNCPGMQPSLSWRPETTTAERHWGCWQAQPFCGCLRPVPCADPQQVARRSQLQRGNLPGSLQPQQHSAVISFLLSPFRLAAVHSAIHTLMLGSRYPVFCRGCELGTAWGLQLCTAAAAAAPVPSVPCLLPQGGPCMPLHPRPHQKGHNCRASPALAAVFGSLRSFELLWGEAGQGGDAASRSTELYFGSLRGH